LNTFDEAFTPLLIFLAQIFVAVLVLSALGRFLRIFPHAPLVILGAVPALLAWGLVFSPIVLVPLLILDGIIVCLAIADLFTLPSRSTFSVERKAGRTVSLAKEHLIVLILTNRSTRERFVTVRDDVPIELHPNPSEIRLLLPPSSQTYSEYHLTSSRRGAFHLSATHLQIRSSLGLWRRFMSYPVETVIHVYPDMKQLSEYALLARTNRLSQLGVRRTRKIGQDNEFERLRDYTPDDNFRHIDWRSSARRNKLTVRDFQRNQSQRVIFLLDCGRMMTNQASGLSLLDHALNSLLMLSYVALNHGDSVGLICFSDEVHSYVPPHGGLSQMNRLLHAAFDRFPRLVESRYDKAFLYLGSHCLKRSMVVLISNVIDDVNSNQIEEYLATLVGRHLPLGVLLRDRRVFEYAEMHQPHGRDLFRAAAAADILTWRHQSLRDLANKGVLALDVFPEDMTAPLINQYLDAKARHLL
jgi:uncharacterized protein (DUF58 family)